MDGSFEALRMHRGEAGPTLSLDRIGPSDVPEGEVTIRTLWSSLNYKDALILAGRGGDIAAYPHVAGIDLSGVVEPPGTPDLPPGTPVLATGASVGERLWGGYAGLARLPADRILPIPDGLHPRTAMILGTAGLTAMLAIEAFDAAGARPGEGTALVTGAGGGVGTIAVMLLSALGWPVVAVEKRPDAAQALARIGAASILGPDGLADRSRPPVGEALWQVAVDTVGGPVLADVLRSTARHGVVAACGMVAGFDVPLNLHPFFGRAIRLVGIDSVNAERGLRERCWARLAGLAPGLPLAGIAEEIALADVQARAERLLSAGVTGRIVVRIGAAG